MFKTIITLFLVAFALSVKLPPNFQKCSRDQPDLKECVLKAAQNGISQLTKPYEELNIPNLNPFELSEVSLGGGSGPVAVNQKFTNCKMYGFHGLKLDRFEFDFDKKTLNVKGIYPEIQMLCNYELKGQILVIPVDGTGNSTITSKNLKISSLLRYEEVKKKGKTHLKFLSNELDMEPELVVFNFQNNGERSITDNLNPVLNDNWKAIFDDVKEGYSEIINRIALSLLNGFFSKVSMDEALE